MTLFAQYLNKEPQKTILLPMQTDDLTLPDISMMSYLTGKDIRNDDLLETFK